MILQLCTNIHSLIQYRARCVEAQQNTLSLMYAVYVLTYSFSTAIISTKCKQVVVLYLDI